MEDEELKARIKARRNERLEAIGAFVDEHAALLVPDELDYPEDPTTGPLLITGWVLVVRVQDMGDDSPHAEFEGTFFAAP